MFSKISHNDQTALYLRLIRRWWWLPVLFGLVSASVTYAASSYLLKPVYQVSTTLQVVSPNAGLSYLTASDAGTDAVLITSSPVVRAAATKLNSVARRDPGALYRSSCGADSTNTFITCTTTGRDYRAAAAALNTLTQTFLLVNQRNQSAQYAPSLQSLQTQEAQLRKSINGLQGQLAQLRNVISPTAGQQYQLTATSGQLSQDDASLSQLTIQESTIRQQIIAEASSVHIVDQALPVANAISPHPAKNAILGFIIGIALAASLILIFEYLDDSFHSIEEIGELTGAAILGVVRPVNGLVHGSWLVPKRSPSSPYAEAYRVAMTNLDFTAMDRPLSLLLVTGALEGEGKTTTATNLAAAAAMAGRRVLLVDVDLRRAGLSRSFQLRNRPGLTNALLDPSHDPVAVPTEVPNLFVVPSGALPPNAAEFLGSSRLREWLERAKRQYDLVILDAPPVLSLADTRMLAPVADGAVLVVDPSIVSRRLVRQARQALEAVGARLVGVIVNRGSFVGDREYDYMYYGYGSYSDTEDGKKSRKSAVTDMGGRDLLQSEIRQVAE